MTNLELAICEAENAGEINLDTRDIMLGILNESTAEARYAEGIYKEIEKKTNLIDKLYDIIDTSKKEDDSRKYYRIKKDAQEKITKLRKEIGELYGKIDKHAKPI